MKKNGFMARVDGFPWSRDFAATEIPCAAIDCCANYNQRCTMPSRVKIDANGKCLGYKKR